MRWISVVQTLQFAGQQRQHGSSQKQGSSRTVYSSWRTCNLEIPCQHMPLLHDVHECDRPKLWSTRDQIMAAMSMASAVDMMASAKAAETGRSQKEEGMKGTCRISISRRYFKSTKLAAHTSFQFDAR